MEERIEKIIESIEQSFNQLNTSVEQLQKAENVASSSVATTSTLITEFKTSIQSIEKLVKVDFANEYNKVVRLHNQMLERISNVDFDSKFKEVNTNLEKKNFDIKFNEISQQIADKNFDDKFETVNTSIEKKNFDTKFNDISQQIADKNFDDKFKEVNTNIEKKNFDTEFDALNKRLLDQDKMLNVLKTALLVVCGLIVIGFVVTIFVLK
jgi:CHASE3 domain sensor protein